MNSLKIILGLVYPILIILLLLSNCKGCRSNEGERDRNTEEPVDTSTDIREPIDTAGIVRHARETGHSGNLKITLLWDFQGDIDLHVTQPNGRTINFENMEDSSTGGTLDVDNKRGGNGSAENIYWENPPRGEYFVFLNYYQASTSTDIAESGICTVVVFQEGKPEQTYRVEMRNVKDTKDVVTVNIR